MKMDYSVKLYTSLVPKTVIFHGFATLSGATTFINMATLNNPEQRLQSLAILNKEGEVDIPPSDLVPYGTKIYKRI